MGGETKRMKKKTHYFLILFTFRFISTRKKENELLSNELHQVTPNVTAYVCRRARMCACVDNLVFVFSIEPNIANSFGDILPE